MYIVPEDFNVPVDEPAQLQPSTPADIEAVRKYIVDNRLEYWRVKCKCLYSDTQITITGYTPGMVFARLKGVVGAWPLPGRYISGQWPPAKPANAIEVLQYPA